MTTDEMQRQANDRLKRMQENDPRGSAPPRSVPSGTPRPKPREGSQPSKLSQTSDYQPSRERGNSGGQERPVRSGKPSPTPQQNKSSGLNIKQIGLIVGAVLIVGVIAFVVFGMKGKDGEQEQEVVEQIPIVEEVPLETPIVEAPIIAFMYTEEEVKSLRAAGYTGDEIEAYQYMEKDVQELLDEAAKEQQEYVDMFVKPLLDETSDAYKKNLRDTWLGLEERTDIADFSDYLFVNSETKNLDFEKVPVRGNQIFLKIYLDDVNHDDYFFMSCDPKRYAQLGDSGNIVITYQYIHPHYFDENNIQQEDTSRMLILDAYEVTVTN